MPSRQWRNTAVQLRVEVDYERPRFAFCIGGDWHWLPVDFDGDRKKPEVKTEIHLMVKTILIGSYRSFRAVAPVTTALALAVF